MEEMSDEELRGIILEELWKHRRKGIVRFDEALKDLPMSIEICRPSALVGQNELIA